MFIANSGMKPFKAFSFFRASSSKAWLLVGLICSSLLSGEAFAKVSKKQSISKSPARKKKKEKLITYPGMVSIPENPIVKAAWASNESRTTISNFQIESPPFIMDTTRDQQDPSILLQNIGTTHNIVVTDISFSDKDFFLLDYRLPALGPGQLSKINIHYQPNIYDDYKKSDFNVRIANIRIKWQERSNQETPKTYSADIPIKVDKVPMITCAPYVTVISLSQEWIQKRTPVSKSISCHYEVPRPLEKPNVHIANETENQVVHSTGVQAHTLFQINQDVQSSTDPNETQIKIQFTPPIDACKTLPCNISKWTIELHDQYNRFIGAVKVSLEDTILSTTNSDTFIFREDVQPNPQLTFSRDGKPLPAFNKFLKKFQDGRRQTLTSLYNSDPSESLLDPSLKKILRTTHPDWLVATPHGSLVSGRSLDARDSQIFPIQPHAFLKSSAAGHDLSVGMVQQLWIGNENFFGFSPAAVLSYEYDHLKEMIPAAEFIAGGFFSSQSLPDDTFSKEFVRFRAGLGYGPWLGTKKRWGIFGKLLFGVGTGFGKFDPVGVDMAPRLSIKYRFHPRAYLGFEFAYMLQLYPVRNGAEATHPLAGVIHGPMFSIKIGFLPRPYALPKKW